MRAVVLSLMFLLAGCSEAPAPVPECTVDCLDEVVDDEPVPLTADVEVAAPQWEVGTVFEQHLYLGSRDTEGTHIQTVVVDNANGYTVATTDRPSARYEAVYDLPVLGHIGDELETSGFGSDWSWMYDFPLSDGKTWQGSIEGLLNWNTFNFTDHEVTMTATFAEAIESRDGTLPGFWIEAIDEAGQLVARYNYVPERGWFTDLWLFDLDAGGDEAMFHATSMGTSYGYDGFYLIGESEEVLDHFQGVFPNPTGPVQGDPLPQTFTVPEAERLMGIVVVIAAGGQTEVTLTDPRGEQMAYGFQQLGLDGQSFQVYFFDEEAVEGEWQSRVVGAGVATGAYVWLQAVTVTEGTLAA